MQNYFLVRKGQKNDLTELQKLFVNSITTICASDYDKQQIEVWTSSVENKKRWNEIITKQFILVAKTKRKLLVLRHLTTEIILTFCMFTKTTNDKE